MEDFFLQSYFKDIIGRAEGVMNFRLIMHPLVAIYFAVRGGLRDSKANKPPFFWALAFHPEHHQNLVQSSCKDLWRFLITVFLLDTVYQITVFHFFYPIQALITVITMGLVPYLLFRALITRIANTLK
jgi:hypothetical protein